MLLATAILFGVAACSPIYRDHGYTPPESQLAQLTLGESTKEHVLEVAGSPFTTNDNYGETWFYVSSRFSQEGYRETKEVDRRLVAISFDAEGRVANVQRYALRDGRTVALSRRITETSAGRLTFIDQLLRGLGRLDPVRSIGRQ